MNLEKIKNSNKRAISAIVNILPITFGILLLISIITNITPGSFYKNLFTGNLLSDSLIGDILGSVFIGNPITGYIAGNELLKSGVSLVAVTAFLVAWVTVGVIQSPAEAKALGNKFAIFRNICAFFMAIIAALITVFIVEIY
ncbi:hypothetical protein [Ancylomarina longa]|uniref:Permease n=1 Tax=Ancylomarina longa TaxID=2487017 RepID=A0A434AXP5_9BACT|nr:hypothetical protein [Ancylomarina longa]RUT79320.1 hypothetical protein DLK05_03610 [Ancylomarina longa]